MMVRCKNAEVPTIRFDLYKKSAQSSLSLTTTSFEMPSFSLPHIHDNPDGGWGPPATSLPERFKFKDIPYAPYSKSDKLGRFADWNDISTDNRQSTAAASQQNTRGGAPGRRRDGAQTFGSGTASAFTYFHVEDESSFSVVDNKTTAPRRGGGFSRGGRGTSRGASSYASRGMNRGGRGGASGTRGGAQRGGRRGMRDWDKVCGVHLITLRADD
jgi:translation initiation factor 3 subunit D